MLKSTSARFEASHLCGPRSESESLFRQQMQLLIANLHQQLLHVSRWLLLRMLFLGRSRVLFWTKTNRKKKVQQNLLSIAFNINEPENRLLLTELTWRYRKKAIFILFLGCLSYATNGNFPSTISHGPWWWTLLMHTNDADWNHVAPGRPSNLSFRRNQFIQFVLVCQILRRKREMNQSKSDILIVLGVGKHVFLERIQSRLRVTVRNSSFVLFIVSFVLSLLERQLTQLQGISLELTKLFLDLLELHSFLVEFRSFAALLIDCQRPTNFSSIFPNDVEFTVFLYRFPFSRIVWLRVMKSILMSAARKSYRPCSIAPWTGSSHYLLWLFPNYSVSVIIQQCDAICWRYGSDYDIKQISPYKMPCDKDNHAEFWIHFGGNLIDILVHLNFSSGFFI